MELHDEDGGRGHAAVDQAVAEHYVNIQNKQVEIKRAEPRNNPEVGNGPVVDQWGAQTTNGISLEARKD